MLAQSQRDLTPEKAAEMLRGQQEIHFSQKPPSHHTKTEGSSVQQWKATLEKLPVWAQLWFKTEVQRKGICFLK